MSGLKATREPLPARDVPLQVVTPVETDSVEALDVFVGFLRHFHRYRALVVSFVGNDLKFRYAGSSLGFFWTVVDPILELAIYTFVFSVLLKVRFAPEGDTTNYALFLFCGMITWFNVSETLSRCTSVLPENGHLLKKMNFPSAILPAHVILSGMVHQVIRTFILILGILVAGYGLSLHALLTPLVWLMQVFFVLGLGMILAVASVYFKDLAHLVKAFLMVWMFITPIFYPPASFPRRFYALLVLNPLSHLIGMYQELLLNQRVPHQGSIIIFGTVAFFSFFVGSYIFARFQSSFADLV